MFLRGTPVRSWRRTSHRRSLGRSAGDSASPIPQVDALEDTIDLDVFTPPRADWIDGTDAYLRK